ncbi:MAG: hypothetical protein Q9170_005165 [Blastenia crenularia]
MAENFVAEAFSLLAIALVVIVLRWISRLLTVGFSKLAADDYLMVVAGALYSAETTVAYYVGAKWKGLANSGITPEERAALDPQGEEYRLRVGGSKNQLVGWLTYTVLLWTLKTCMLVFYSRLTDGVNNMRLRIRVGAVLLIITFLATFLTILLGCQPIRGHWQVNPDPGNDLDIASHDQEESGINGPQQAGEWSIRESFVAVIVGNLPMLYTLVQRLQQHGSRSWNKSSDKRSYPLNSYQSSKMAKKAKKFHHPLSMPNDTAMDSDERIVIEPKQEHEQGSTAISNGNRPAYTYGGDRNPETGIRVQTDLHVESSREPQVEVGRRNDYDQFQASRV